MSIKNLFTQYFLMGIWEGGNIASSTSGVLYTTEGIFTTGEGEKATHDRGNIERKEQHKEMKVM